MISNQTGNEIKSAEKYLHITHPEMNIRDNKRLLKLKTPKEKVQEGIRRTAKDKVNKAPTQLKKYKDANQAHMTVQEAACKAGEKIKGYS